MSALIEQLNHVSLSFDKISEGTCADGIVFDVLDLSTSKYPHCSTLGIEMLDYKGAVAAVLAQG